MTANAQLPVHGYMPAVSLAALCPIQPVVNEGAPASRYDKSCGDKVRENVIAQLANCKTHHQVHFGARRADRPTGLGLQH